MIDTNLYLIPISSCLRTCGYCRTLVMDMHKREMKYIPNILHNILTKHKHNRIKDILKQYPLEHHNTIMEYFDFLYEERLIYLGSKEETKLFSDFNYEWDFPSLISNSIVEIKSQSDIDYQNIIDQLDELSCFYLYIRFFDELNEDFIREILKYANSKSFRTIDISFNNKNINHDILVEFINNFTKINRVFVHSSPKNELYKFEDLLAYIIYSENNLCGTINPNKFSLRIEHFTESQLHNTCLNRKVCIDSNGYIKNCPSMQQHYGHISDTSLLEAIEKPAFKDLWFVKKDDIDVCKDCEFRHICTDCRAHIKDPNNIYSQPSKCGYNPYIALWEGQEGWISVEQWRKENPDWEKEALENR